jgi:Protein of unknown function (DUF2806)
MDINIPDISKPATVLIEKISDAIGGLAAPWQIVRMANAKAEADRIQAESQIRITDLQHRAFYRFLEEEAKKQVNMEEIIRRALPLLSDKSEPAHIENDWITNFFDKCRLISDEEMQALWSRILAGEANLPGSYSKRTVNFLASLDKMDAILFTKLCTFVWTIDNEPRVLVFDHDSELYKRYDITFDSLNHLDSIGLIQFSALYKYGLRELQRKLIVFYHGQEIPLELENDLGNTIDTGHVMLTKIGQELVPICGSAPDDEFRDYVLTKWKGMGYIKEEMKVSHRC